MNFRAGGRGAALRRLAVSTALAVWLLPLASSCSKTVAVEDEFTRASERVAKSRWRPQH